MDTSFQANNILHLVIVSAVLLVGLAFCVFSFRSSMISSGLRRLESPSLSTEVAGTVANASIVRVKRAGGSSDDLFTGVIRYSYGYDDHEYASVAMIDGGFYVKSVAEQIEGYAPGQIVEVRDGWISEAPVQHGRVQKAVLKFAEEKVAPKLNGGQVLTAGERKAALLQEPLRELVAPTLRNASVTVRIVKSAPEVSALVDSDGRAAVPGLAGAAFLGALAVAAIGLGASPFLGRWGIVLGVILSFAFFLAGNFAGRTALFERVWKKEMPQSTGELLFVWGEEEKPIPSVAERPE